MNKPTLTAPLPTRTSPVPTGSVGARKRAHINLTWLIPTVVIATVLGLWEILVRTLDIPVYLLPAPSVIAHEIFMERSLLASHLRITLIEVLAGFALAFVSSFILGVALGYSQHIRRAIFPLIVALQTIPIIVIAPLLLIWFGYNLTPKILLTALICFFPLAINTAAGFITRDAETERMIHALGGTRLQRFFTFALPSALPHIFTGTKISVTLSVIGATVSEWTGSSEGLGHLILVDTGQLDTTRVFASITLLSLIGIILFAVVAILEKVATPWRHRTQRRRRKSPRIQL